jgi:hypothetical protein
VQSAFTELSSFYYYYFLSHFEKTGRRRWILFIFIFFGFGPSLAELGAREDLRNRLEKVFGRASVGRHLRLASDNTHNLEAAIEGH